MLHTVNKSPFEKNSLESCMRLAQDGSAILLIEDAVYGAMQDTRLAEAVKQTAARCKLYALGPDLAARGVPTEKVVAGVTVVDYGGFVDLVEQNNPVQAWL